MDGSAGAREPVQGASEADQAPSKEQPRVASLAGDADPEEPSDKKPLLAANRKATMVNYSGLPQVDTEKVAEKASEDALLEPTPDGYYPHLDVWRAICIAVVVLDHGNGHYSEWNLLFGQNWTLQFIFVICGICFGLTRRGIGGYLLRLAGYVFVGVTCNLVARVIVRDEWWKDPWNVVFQFWFVVALIGYSLMLLPLKWYLAGFKDRQVEAQASLAGDAEAGGAQALKAGLSARELAGGLFAVFGGLFGIWFILSNGLARLLADSMGAEFAALTKRLGPGFAYWMGSPDQAITGIIAALELSISNIWLALAVPAMFPSQAPYTGWLILINMHLRRLSLWYSGIGEKLMNGLDLMLLGLVCYYLGFKFRRPIGQKMARYWFVWISICGLVWKPGTHGRMDLLMPEEWTMRWRMQFLDTVFMVMFLTAGERTVDPRIFTEDKCNFINYLGLFLFLVHKAIHIVCPEPWNWLVILTWIPVFMYLYKPKK